MELCKNCVHFLPPHRRNFWTKPDLKKGKCSLFAKISPVDGEIDLESAKFARNELCKGKFFKKSDPDFSHSLFFGIQPFQKSEPDSNCSDTE
jgi:hypothetical protein